MNQVEPSCLTYYSTQPKSFSDIKYNLDYPNLHVWGSIKIFIFLTIILTLHLWEEKFWQEKCLIEMHKKRTIGLEGVGQANLNVSIHIILFKFYNMG